MTVSLKLDEATHQKVVTIAALKDKTPHWIMCNAVKRYVEHEEKLQEFRQAAFSCSTCVPLTRTTNTKNDKNHKSKRYRKNRKGYRGLCDLLTMTN